MNVKLSDLSCTKSVITMNLGLSFPKYIRIMPWIFHYLLWILPFSMGQLITAVETITFEFKNDNPRYV